MANLTKAQRHNKMLEDTFNTYYKQQEGKKDFLPTISEYSFFLDKAQEKFKITRNEARDKYGKFTHGQWKELLKLF
jgi:hypothetical protein